MLAHVITYSIASKMIKCLQKEIKFPIITFQSLASLDKLSKHTTILHDKGL